MTANADFTRRLDTLQQRVSALQQRTTAGPAQAEGHLRDALEELQTSLEELHAADEELRQQNEDLAGAYLAVEAERQRYEELFEFAPDGYLVTDVDGNIKEANRAAAALLGVSQDYLVDKPLTVFVAPEELRAFRSRLADAAQRRPGRIWDTRLQRRDGGSFYAALSMTPVQASSGQVRGLRWLMRDISERKQLQDSLRNERDFIAAVLDTTDALVLVLDAHGRLVRWNRACEELTGYTGAQVEDKDVCELFVPPEEAARVQARFDALRHSRGRQDDEYHWITRQGERRLIRWSHTALCDPAGQVEYVVATGVDLTDLRQTQQDLQKTAATTQAILDTVADSIITIDERGVIELVNPAAERMFGYTAQEMTGQNVSMLMPAPYRDQHDDYITRYVRTGEKRIIGIGREVVGQRKDGSTFPMDLAVTEVRLGQRRLFTGVVRDITHRKRVEQEMQRAERMAVMGQLASGLAHEIGTPLNVIAGNAELLRTDLRQHGLALDELNTIVAQTDRVTHLMQQLLNLARAPQSTMEPCSLHEPLSQALRLLQTRFAHEAVTVIVEVPSDLPPVWGAADRLEQVFLNVLINAWHAMPDGGTITIRACAPDERYVRLRLHDTGVGMCAAEAGRVFEPFYTTKGERGTGLGLAICRQIIEDHEGSIRLDSTPGAGTTVTIELLQADAQAPGP
jgi:PAS domain S-box-containing protein